ncbi:MAG TPA: hypothetical protein VFJ03_00145 [Candidatus Limnocylindria bacterium]|jgi:hypothetical protein|nr:hypothetical protein [Candidatus Limnocylindria bacterium]
MVNAGEAPLLAAASSADLTPPAGLPLGGYVLREGAAATGTHDPLEANLVLIRGRSGGGEVLWVTLDALAVDGELAASVADAVASAAGCPRNAVLVCASHTHSSAAGWMASSSPALPDTRDDALRQRLLEQLADAAAQLADRLEPAWPAFGEGQAPAAGSNRNDPAGPHDPSVGAFGLVDEQGRLLAAVIDYACHATVLGHANLRWSADWPGAARRALAGALETTAPFAVPGTQPGLRAPVVAFLQGAAGDASPRFVRRDQGFGEVDRLGGLVAAGALAGLLTATPEPTGAPIVVMRRDVVVPTRELPNSDTLRDQLDQTERAWQAARASRAPAAEERIARTRYEGAMVLQALAAAGLPPVLEAPVRVVAIGEGAWVHLPTELFASLGLAIREASPFGWTRVVGYTDAYLGYVADSPAHRAGVYEALASSFGPDAGEVLVEAARDLLRDAHSAIGVPPATVGAGDAL